MSPRLLRHAEDGKASAAQLTDRRSWPRRPGPATTDARVRCAPRPLCSRGGSHGRSRCSLGTVVACQTRAGDAGAKLRRCVAERSGGQSGRPLCLPIARRAGGVSRTGRQPCRSQSQGTGPPGGAPACGAPELAAHATSATQTRRRTEQSDRRWRQGRHRLQHGILETPCPSKDDLSPRARTSDRQYLAPSRSRRRTTNPLEQPDDIHIIRDAGLSGARAWRCWRCG
jgi:hypothetical protein